jgi:hypothetical protein
MLCERMRIADMIESVLPGQNGAFLVNNPIVLRKKLIAAERVATKEEKQKIKELCHNLIVLYGFSDGYLSTQFSILESRFEE